MPEGFLGSIYRVDHIVRLERRDRKRIDGNGRGKTGKEGGSMSGVITKRGTEYGSGRLNRSHVSLTLQYDGELSKGTYEDEDVEIGLLLWGA